MLELSIIIVTLIVLLTAAITDIKTLEVPDWVNFAGIGAGLGIHLIFSVQQWQIWPIASSVIGLIIGFAIACLMFYTGQWGGGDAKLLMAMGALIGFQPEKFGIGTSFLVNLVFFGGMWGLVWSMGLAIHNRKRFYKTFKAMRHHKPYARLRIMSLLSALILIVLSFVLTTIKIELLALALVTYVLSYLTIFIKSVELSGMHKWITPDKLTEGDWLVHDVKIGKEHICPGKLGLNTDQVKKLKKLYQQKKLQKVLVKYGVPFTPAFLIAFVYAIILGNIVLTIMY